MARRRRRFRPRRGDAQAPPSAAADARPGGRTSLLFVLLVLLVGYWLGRIATLVPTDALPALDITAALLCAVLFAVWYRRRAREYLATRQAAERERRASARGEETTE
ncbi:MAG: hypothetical protein F4Z25_04505 [Chloroflexi bacterium]|nr:hypothetical protein [Chloroflexota bacterium]